VAGSPFHAAEEAKEISEVNVVPLADVSLVLLIILLTLSPMMTQDLLRIQTAAKDAAAPPEPSVETAPAPEKPPELVLVVGLSQAGISVGEKTFAGPGEFMGYMRGELARRSDRKVFLAPQPDVPHGKVVNMLEMLKDCGASSAALVQTEEAAPAPAAAPAARPAPPRRGWIGEL
jgi:biopolymer transport protein ExbD